MVSETRWYSFFVVFLVLPNVMRSIRNVHLQIQPRIVQKGDDVTLICTYNLETDDHLYNVKWYRGTHEFYRYSPDDNPNIKLFPLTNLQIDVKRSDRKQVVIKDTNFVLSGNFICEVTAASSSRVSTMSSRQQMVVVALPFYAPKLTTNKHAYVIGDTLNANCTSGPSRPVITIRFLLNNILVCKKCETKIYPFGDLFFSESSLTISLFPKHFSDGRLKLRCSAQIADVYQRDTDVVLTEIAAGSARRVLPSNKAFGLSLFYMSALLFFCSTAVK